MKIQKNIIQAVITHARQQAPIEACGYLIKKGLTVDSLIEMKNMDNSPTHYTFDPREQLKVLAQAESEKWELAAVYHSHPISPAYPSKEDMRLAFYSDIKYLIVSLTNKKPDLGLFTIQNGLAMAESIDIIE